MAEVVEQPQTPALPQGQQDVKLFNRWSFDDVEVRDWVLLSVSFRSAAASSTIDDGVESPGDLQVKDISLGDYLAVSASKHATYLPHTAGRYSKKRFRKAQCPIVERLTNSLMMHGRNNGKKIMAVRIIKHTMEIIHLLTDANPIQIIVDAIINRFAYLPLPLPCYLRQGELYLTVMPVRTRATVLRDRWCLLDLI
jgi:small subunit ribosomal protein S5e